MTRLYLDDLQVGQRFVSRSYPIDRDQIVRFAREFDPQPFHLNEDSAQVLVGNLIVLRRSKHSGQIHA